MAKKSLIAGEYIIEIADNGHVDVLRVFRNAKVIMEEIAKSNNFEVNPKWNTQDLGRHLVNEFGDGKSVQFKDITVNKLPDGKIEIYQECKNVKDALRTISRQIGFSFEDSWGTQIFGSKLSDYLIEHKEEADKILQTKNAKRKHENVEEPLNNSDSFDISETNNLNRLNNMAKTKTITYENYVITKSEDGSYHIQKDGVNVDNVKACLREIANEIGFEFNLDWNQRQLASNVIKAIENTADVSNEEYDASEESRTYIIRLEAQNVWRFDTMEIENADDAEIEEAFEDQYGWTSIVGETSNLYCLKEDIDNESVFGCDDDDVERLSSIIGDGYVNCGRYLPDAEEEFSVVVTTEEGDEIDRIDSSDILKFSSEQGYRVNLDDFDEEEENYAAVQKYLEENDPDKIDHAFCGADEGIWSWINVQKCTVDECPTYSLQISGKFDPSKLVFKKALIEEALNGMMSVEVISEVIYDGEVLYVEDTGVTDNEEATNFFVKTGEDGVFPEKVYDFTNYEES